MPFPIDFLDELRAHTSLSALIGRRVKLMRRGREWTGLCPFHNEKTPSFTVNEDKGFFHCFGCGQHGDAIGFAMRSEGLSFPEAVEKLAGEAGLQVPRATPAEIERVEKRAGLVDVVEAACRWFEQRLQAPEGKRALDYLRGRGLDEATVARFRLGYAPDSRDVLVRALAAQSIPLDKLIEAGLAKRPEDGREPFAMFRNRVMFPIADRAGRTVAFGGRVLGEGEPKYLNSPDTPLFDKGRMLYALHLARRAVADGAEAIACEGYMDVIALHRAGFGGAVAPLGTALSENQLHALWRLAPEPILCFDGDAAGQRAAARAALRALPLVGPGRSLRFAELPAGQDPDDLLRRQGPPAMRAALDAAVPLVEAVWRLETAGRSFDTPERRAALRKTLDQRAASIEERSVQDGYRTEFRRRLDALFGAAFPARGGGQGRWGFKSGFRPPWVGGGVITPAFGEGARLAPADPAWNRWRLIVAALLYHPQLVDELGEKVMHMAAPNSDLDNMVQGLHIARNSGLELAEVRRHLTQHGFAEAVADVERLANEPQWASVGPKSSIDVARRLCIQSVERIEAEAVDAEFRAAEEALGEHPSPEMLTSHANLADLRRQMRARVSALEDEDPTRPSGPGVR